MNHQAVARCLRKTDVRIIDCVDDGDPAPQRRWEKRQHGYRGGDKRRNLSMPEVGSHLWMEAQVQQYLATGDYVGLFVD